MVDGNCPELEAKDALFLIGAQLAQVLPRSYMNICLASVTPQRLQKIQAFPDRQLPFMAVSHKDRTWLCQSIGNLTSPSPLVAC